MRVFDVQKAAGRVQFRLSGCDLAVASALRRALLTDVPTRGIAIEDVTVLENGSSLHNEQLVHRLALIPLHKADDVEELVLDVTNPGAPSAEVLTVTLGDHARVQRIGSDELGDAGEVDPPHALTGDRVPLVRLAPGARLHLRAPVTTRTAAVHAGFCPVSLCLCTYVDHPDDPSDFAFALEVENGADPADLVGAALDSVADRVTRAANEAAAAAAQQPATEFNLSDADDTVGALVQACLDPHVAFVGYLMPHPLQRTIVVRVAPALEAARLSSLLNDAAASLREFGAQAREALSGL